MQQSVVCIVGAVVLLGCIYDSQAARIRRNDGDSGAVTGAPYQWTDWQAWSACEGATCSHSGTHSRDRKCQDMANDNEFVDIVKCQDPAVTAGGGDDRRRRKRGSTMLKETETQACNATGCAINGGWTLWSDWSGCSVTAGTGSQIRMRTCTNPVPENGGHLCSGDTQQKISCTVNEWSEWKAWAAGSGDDGSLMTRVRTCLSGSDCVGAAEETSPCTIAACAKDGQWGAWSSYGACSATCGNGVSFRHRACDSPGPSNGGANCTGSTHDFSNCNNGPCPIDGGWSNWTSLACSVTCGIGVQASFRKCNNPAPEFGGNPCDGDTHLFQYCNTPCAVNGNWSTWGNWSQCSVTSGSGLRTRMRTCTNPAPMYGGLNCTGLSLEKEPCVVNMWTEWSGFSSCSTTCGTGIQIRTRLCMTGSDCVGLGTNSRVCTLASCKLDGAWGAWSAWSDCSSMCGQGHRYRHRTCDNPAPQDGGYNCTGASTETAACESVACPHDVRICDSTLVKHAVSVNQALLPLQQPPCSNVEILGQQMMMSSFCGAPSSSSEWTLANDIHAICDRLPLYVPITSTKTRKYGILTECYNGKLKMVTDKCDRGVIEETVNIGSNDTDYYTVTW